MYYDPRLPVPGVLLISFYPLYYGSNALYNFYLTFVIGLV